MIYRFQCLLALVSLFTLSCGYAADRYVAFVTPMLCGDMKAQISLDCIKSKDPMALNDCKMPQKLTFIGGNSQVLKQIQIPSFKPNEIEKFKKAGTDQSMFAHTWSCINKGNETYLLISYVDSEMGHNPYSEYVEIYGASSEEVIAQDKIQQLIGIKDKVGARSAFIKSIFPE